jgi:hypothetical protein
LSPLHEYWTGICALSANAGLVTANFVGFAGTTGGGDAVVVEAPGAVEAGSSGSVWRCTGAPPHAARITVNDVTAAATASLIAVCIPLPARDVAGGWPGNPSTPDAYADDDPLNVRSFSSTAKGTWS